MLEKLFKLSSHKTTVKTEILAGLTTFLAMAYILAVNPGMLGATGMPVQSVFLATAIASGIASIRSSLIPSACSSATAGRRLWPRSLFLE